MGRYSYFSFPKLDNSFFNWVKKFVCEKKELTFIEPTKFGTSAMALRPLHVIGED